MRPCLLPCLATLSVLCSLAELHAAEIPQLVTAQPEFAIPFRHDAVELRRLQAKEVQLFVSSDAGNTWSLAQSTAVESSGFRYQAKADGTYWFFVTVCDVNGQLHPDPARHAPGLQVIVDRVPPVLELQLTKTEAGQASLSWRAADPELALATLKLEYRNSPQEEWKAVYVTPQPSGRTSWKMLPGHLPEVRGRVADRAGNQQETFAQLEQVNPVLPVTTPRLAVQPAPVEQPTVISSSDPVLPQIFPKIQVTSFQSEQAVTPVSGKVTRETLLIPPAPEHISVPDSVPHVAKPMFPESTASTASEAPVKRTHVVSVDEAGKRVSYLNSRNFLVDYQVTGVGPSGVGAVELFITQDNGAQWWRYGLDTDLVSPMLIQVPEDGTYGFHFRVHSGVGNAEIPPQPGQLPQIQVVVDTTPPQLELTGAFQGHGHEIGLLTVEWKYRDQYAAEKPVALLLAAQPDGPWQQVGGMLKNTGSHRFPIPPTATSRLYVKIRGTDLTGNVSESVLPEPVLVDLSKPAAHVLTIDAVR